MGRYKAYVREEIRESAGADPSIDESRFIMAHHNQPKEKNRPQSSDDERNKLSVDGEERNQMHRESVNSLSTFRIEPLVDHDETVTGDMEMKECPVCQIGRIEKKFTLWGILMGIFLCPIGGIYCCYVSRIRVCNNCGTVFD